MTEVAVGILLKGGRVLACRRKASARYALKWEFPGGKLEPEESPAQALKRELHEELTIDAQVGAPFFIQEWRYPPDNAVPHHDGAFRVTYFVITAFTGEPVNIVFEEIRWVEPPVLLTMDILDGNRDAVTRLVQDFEERHAS